MEQHPNRRRLIGGSALVDLAPPFLSLFNAWAIRSAICFASPPGVNPTAAASAL
jgi:hypothetical protein